MSERSEALPTAPQYDQKSEEEFISDMKNTIRTKIQQVARKVNTSAIHHMEKKQWISETNIPEAETFFTEKIPKVLADEISKNLDDILGL